MHVCTYSDVTGWKPLHIAVFETKVEDKVIPLNQQEKKDKEERKQKGKGKEEEEEVEGSRRNPDGTMRGVLVAVCPLYVKYNRYTVDGKPGILCDGRPGILCDGRPGILCDGRPGILCVIRLFCWKIHHADNFLFFL